MFPKGKQALKQEKKVVGQQEINKKVLKTEEEKKRELDKIRRYYKKTTNVLAELKICLQNYFKTKIQKNQRNMKIIEMIFQNTEEKDRAEHNDKERDKF